MVTRSLDVQFPLFLFIAISLILTFLIASNPAVRHFLLYCLESYTYEI